MGFVDWIGFVGVFLILLAYFLQTIRVMESTSIYYVLLNLIGAILACSASILLNYIPFIILEGVWAIGISIFSFKSFEKKQHLASYILIPYAKSPASPKPGTI